MSNILVTLIALCCNDIICCIAAQNESDESKYQSLQYITNFIQEHIWSRESNADPPPKNNFYIFHRMISYLIKNTTFIANYVRQIFAPYTLLEVMVIIIIGALFLHMKFPPAATNKKKITGRKESSIQDTKKESNVQDIAEDKDHPYKQLNEAEKNEYLRFRLERIPNDVHVNTIRYSLQPIIFSCYPKHGNSVTDKLLKMERSKLMRLVKNPKALSSKIQEMVYFQEAFEDDSSSEDEATKRQHHSTARHYDIIQQMNRNHKQNEKKEEVRDVETKAESEKALSDNSKCNVSTTATNHKTTAADRETLGLSVPLMIFNFMYGIVKIPINIVRFMVERVRSSVQNTVQEQQQQFEKTIYVKSSHKKKLTGKQGRKKKNLMNESGVNDIIVGTTTIPGSSDDYVSVLLKGSEDAIQNAIRMINDTIGTANVSCEIIDQPTHTEQREETATTSSTAASNSSEPRRPNLEDNIPEDSNVQPTPDDASSVTHTQEQNNAGNDAKDSAPAHQSFYKDRPNRDPNETTLFIRNISNETTEEDIRALFEPYGLKTNNKILNVVLIPVRGFCFIDFDGTDCISAIVNEATTSIKKDPKTGRKTKSSFMIHGRVLEVDGKVPKQQEPRRYRSHSPEADEREQWEHDFRRHRSLAKRDRLKKIREREELQQQLRKEEETRLAELAKQEEAAQQTKDQQRAEAEQLERNRAKATKKKNMKKEDTVVKVDAVANTEQAKDQEGASFLVVKEEEEDFYFTIEEPDNDPLLLFLQSQHQCIKGSVDEFYTWLVKSEDIDSMSALKEAVSDDVYLNEKMKKRDGSSGVKGFKLKPFQRAVREYDTKSTAKVHQSFPQCQKNIVSDTQEPPDELVCPISLVLMTNDPVVAADGITYERASIKDWFKKSKAKGNIIYSPVHGTKLKNLALTPNIGTRNMARAFKERS